jgi:Flp pilus assembly protein TadG
MATYALIQPVFSTRTQRGTNRIRARRRRRGLAIVYVAISMSVMMGFCSLAVDLARVQAAKTELRTAVDAAARAAACSLPQGSSTARAAAIAIANANAVDGTALTLTSSNILIGSWNTSTHTFTNGGTADNVTTFQAVQVNASRSAANNNPIPLMFGAVIGIRTCNVTASSVASLITQPSSTTQYISAHGDPWLAGEPKNTQASEPDTGYNNPSANSTHPWKRDVANPGAVATATTNAGSSGTYTAPTDSTKLYSTDYSANEPYASPSGFTLSVTPGSVIQVYVPLNSSNLANNQGALTGGTGDTYANGDSAGDYTLLSDDAANPANSQGTTTTSGSEHGISNIIAPLNSLIGVFLDKNGATHGADSTQETSESNPPATPSGLDFSTQTSRDYVMITPKLNQSFYVGNGQTSTGITQSIIVPPNTYEMFLGNMDGHEWSNNAGGFTATITQYQVQTVQ